MSKKSLAILMWARMRPNDPTKFPQISHFPVSLSLEDREKLLLVLAKDYDVNREQVRELVKQYLGLENPASDDKEALASVFYRIERNLRHALKPTYEVLFERLSTHPGGLRFLCILRADLLSILTLCSLFPISLPKLKY